MAYIIVEKFPHCAKNVWLYESKIHEAQRQFTGDAWLNYDKGFRLKMQAHPDMERDEEDVARYMHKMMIAREAKSWAGTSERPFRRSNQKGRQEKVKPFYKRQQYTQWKGSQTGKGTTVVCGLQIQARVLHMRVGQPAAECKKGRGSIHRRDKEKKK
ncbi:hypothetical protein NDU88_003969 [Pleurodeles waltl]|uniref:Uncharacterized protein n=1 Tax=Pleurodeles waltl TaxID=8319 RepID=A0AAV7QAI1_PLEWA|nr:hypothetical protein NDU88_003969 [Pleurodeles waltl]